MRRRRHILVLRFSAIGDVAIAAPLMREYAARNPDVRFTFVSNGRLKPLFEGVKNLHFHSVDFKNEHKGIKGLVKLYRELTRLKPTAVADFHGVLRSLFLDALFALAFIKVRVIDKGRREKALLTRRTGKVLKPLKSSMSRYESVLCRVGLDSINFAEAKISQAPLRENEEFKIGIAPFAKHKGKMWPYEKMEEVIDYLSRDEGVKVFLFGGGKDEVNALMAWQHKFPGVESVAGKYDFEEELQIMSKMDLMVTMDSANMHLASHVGVPVISVWGATHPYAGFTAWGQKEYYTVQYDISCRPCSVFGNKKCFRGDYACLNNITSEMVIDKIDEFRESLQKLK